jgi:hypothetical protein
MKAPIVIVESETSKLILARFLPERPGGLEYAVANGRGSAQSLAGSVLSTGVRPVALVVDADSTDEARVAERREMIGYSLREASGGCPYRLVLAIPAMEIVLVQDEDMLAGLTGVPEALPFELDYAKQDPRQYLRERVCAGADYPSCLARVLNNLPEDLVQRAGSHPVVKEVGDFVRSAGPIGETSEGPLHVDADVSSR